MIQMLFLSLKPTIPVKEEVKQPTHIAKQLVEKDMGSEKVYVKLNSEVNSESLKCQELKTEKKSESTVESAEEEVSKAGNILDLSTNLKPQIIKRFHELYEKVS